MSVAVDVVGVGVAALDYLTRLERFPQPDEKVKSDTLVVSGGGTVGTALVTVSRLGLRAAFAGVVGDDPFGATVLAGLEAEGVANELASIAPGARTTWAFCVAHGDRRNVFSVRGSAPPLEPGLAAIEALLAARALHLDGSEEQASLTLARAARARGVLVSLDGGSVRASSEELIPEVDLLVMSEPFLAELRPGVPRAQALEALHAASPRRLTAVTLGRRGCLAHDGRELIEVAAEVVDVVDSTGAGDVFHGALLVGLLEGMRTRRALEFASHVAALKCRAPGGQTAIPRRHELARWFGAKAGG